MPERSRRTQASTVWTLCACFCLAASGAAAAPLIEKPVPKAPALLPLSTTLDAARAPLRSATPPAGLALGPATTRASGSFFSAYLAPRFASRLGGFDSVVASPAFDAAPITPAWREDLSRSVGRRALGAARSAARSYLVERWDLELDLHREGRGLAVARAHGASSGGVRLGFAGLRPRLTWQRAAGAGSLKLSVDARGRCGVAWNGTSQRTASFGATMDPASGRMEAGWRAAF
jgi:hypothetical protein